jgi:hypothetical protein
MLPRKRVRSSCEEIEEDNFASEMEEKPTSAEMGAAAGSLVNPVQLPG